MFQQFIGALLFQNKQLIIGNAFTGYSESEKCTFFHDVFQMAESKMIK